MSTIEIDIPAHVDIYVYVDVQNAWHPPEGKCLGTHALVRVAKPLTYR